MKIHCLKSGRDEEEFFKKLEDYDDKDYELVNIVPRGNRLMAILKEKAAPKKREKKIEKQTEIRKDVNHG